MSEYDMDALADCYIATQGGTQGAARVLWRMTIRDAQAMCSDPSTAGRGRGGEWALMWTAHDLIPAEADRFAADDGRFAPLMERLGCTVVMSRALLLSGIAQITPSPPVTIRPSKPTAPAQLRLFGEVAA